MKFNLLIADTERSQVYLNYLSQNNLKPQKVFFYANKKNKKILKKLKKEKIDYSFFSTKSINNLKIKKAILSSKLKIFIYSGYPGEKVNFNLTKKKNIIHFHPGLIPTFKGSTVIYYSILLKKSVHCSCLRINQEIDEGEVLLKKKFSLPKKIHLIENKFDSHIRAKTLISFLNKKPQNLKKKFKNKFLEPYYIAHPIIRAMVIHKKSFNFIKNYSLL